MLAGAGPRAMSSIWLNSSQRSLCSLDAPLPGDGYRHGPRFLVGDEGSQILRATRRQASLQALPDICHKSVPWPLAVCYGFMGNLCFSSPGTTPRRRETEHKASRTRLPFSPEHVHQPHLFAGNEIRKRADQMPFAREPVFAPRSMATVFRVSTSVLLGEYRSVGSSRNASPQNRKDNRLPSGINSTRKLQARARHSSF